MVKKIKKISKNTKETQKIAKNFLEDILKKKNKGAHVVGLCGNLGAGKTAFTKAIAKHLSIKTKVNSPTFVIMKRYPISVRSIKFKNLFHLDAYRLKDAKELKKLGWADIISNREHLVFIEWPENIIKAMPKVHHKVFIFHNELGERGFEIQII